jgi:cytidine deaminase
MLAKEERERIIKSAMRVRHFAYAPYSQYQVGAALITRSGRIFTGVNVENAAYPAGICAERTAIFKAITAGEKDYIAMAVVTENGGTPCGSCRQVMAEFSLEMTVIVLDKTGNTILDTTVADLLPGAFGPSDLRTTPNQ